MSFAHRHCSYVDQGRYAPMLERWFDAYGRDQVLVEISEEMYADTAGDVDRVTDRLGIRRHGLRATPSSTTRSRTRARRRDPCRARGASSHRTSPRSRTLLGREAALGFPAERGR